MNIKKNENRSTQAIERVLQAIEDIKQGKMVVMVDDEDRENEGDLVYAGSFSTAQKVNFMATMAKGLICVSVSKKTAEKLDLNPMVKSNNSSYETAFTISVDAKEASTGISAPERDMTIKILANENSKANELVRPGHIFPLIAKEGGSLVRTGHTEGSVDLCKLAGLKEAAVICEIMKEDGTMARRPDLDLFCKEHNLNIVAISDIVEYRLMNESLINLVNSSTQTFLGKSCQKYEFKDHLNNHHMAYCFGKIEKEAYVKFHTIQKDYELFEIANKHTTLINSIDFLEKNNGIVVFMDSSSKNMDQIKEYGIGAQILKNFSIEKIKLLSSSDSIELVGISGFGLEVIETLKV